MILRIPVCVKMMTIAGAFGAIGLINAGAALADDDDYRSPGPVPGVTVMYDDDWFDDDRDDFDWHDNDWDDDDWDDDDRDDDGDD